MAPERTPLTEHIADATALLAPLRRVCSLRLGADAVGAVAARDMRSRVDVPSADNSQMDGYAVSAAQLAGAGPRIELPVGPRIAAGDPPTELTPGTTCPIMTGAPLPGGADLVIPVEEADGGVFASGDQVCLTPQDVTPGRFVRRRGSDTERFETVLREGDVLTPGRIAHLAACGLSEIEAWAPVRVAVVSTGSEVTDPSALELPLGAAFDANGPGLAAALTAAGAQVVCTAAVPDDPRRLLDAVRAAVRADGAELIVTSGGVSQGTVEAVRLAAEDPAARMVFTAVAMQPGGPQGIGTLEVDGSRVPWIALPGNPVSALLSAELILRPALGAPPRQRLRLPIALEEPEASPAALAQFRRARVLPSGTVRLVGGPSSHLVGSLARANALVHVPVGVERLADGDLVETILLPEGER